MQQHIIFVIIFAVLGCIRTARNEAIPNMKKIVHSRFLCIALILSILVLGIYCEEIYINSSFLHVSDTFTAASLQAADHVADTHLFYDKNSINFMEEFVLMRQSAHASTVLRVSQCMICALLLLSIFLLYLSFKNFCLCTDAHQNQYNRRTLDYIHQNDGKKSHNV